VSLPEGGTVGWGKSFCPRQRGRGRGGLTFDSLEELHKEKISCTLAKEQNAQRKTLKILTGGPTPETVPH